MQVNSIWPTNVGIADRPADQCNDHKDIYSLIRTNSRTVDESLTIPTGTNGMSVGPITISANVTVTIETNGEWVVV